MVSTNKKAYFYNWRENNNNNKIKKKLELLLNDSIWYHGLGFLALTIPKQHVRRGGRGNCALDGVTLIAKLFDLRLR